MTIQTLYTYCYAHGRRQISNLILGLGMIGFALVLFYRFDIDTTRIVLITTFCILGAIPLFMTLHYFRVSKNLEIEIHVDNNQIKVNQNGNKVILKLTDLISIHIHEHKGLGLYIFDFDYAKYVFQDGNFFIATSFMTDEYFVPSSIHPELTKEFLPIIWKRNNLKK